MRGSLLLLRLLFTIKVLVHNTFCKELFDFKLKVPSRKMA